MTIRAFACSPRVVERATGRAICLAFAQALERYGAPEEVLTDNGKQFTDRFGRGGEVLFDKICRRNGIAHRLTAPSSPTTTGKIERFHQTLRRELLDDARPFTSLLEAQAALDDWVRDYNAERPHQALETSAPVTPAERFQPASDEQRELLGLWLPGSAGRRPGAGEHADRRARDRRRRRAGRSRAGRSSSTASFRPRGTCGRCAASSGSARSGPGRLSASGPASTSSTSRSPAPASRACARTSAPPTSPSSPARARSRPVRRRCRRPTDGAAIEVDRAVNNSGLVSLAGRQVLAAEILGGRPVIVRIEPQTLMFLDPHTRELLRIGPTRSPPSRRCGCKARAPPARHRAPGPSRSPFSAASAPPA